MLPDTVILILTVIFIKTRVFKLGSDLTTGLFQDDVAIIV